MDNEDALVRNAVFDFLTRETGLRGEVLPFQVLSSGFSWRGARVPLIGPQGIFKPAVLPEMPISIATAPEVEGKERPYEDGLSSDGLLVYRYRGDDPRHRDNVGLRLAMRRRAPLVYLFGVLRGEYLPVWPVYVVRDEPEDLTFTVAVDDRQAGVLAEAAGESVVSEVRRSYVTRLTLQRVHQASFRERVLRAYRDRCAICRLRHTELLDAAHILPDNDPRGEPTVPNGLALCKLHHAAFDRHFVGVRPDLTVTVRADLLREEDGPMLLHGLQGFHGKRIVVPHAAAAQPNAEFLAARFDAFLRAG